MKIKINASDLARHTMTNSGRQITVHLNMGNNVCAQINMDAVSGDGFNDDAYTVTHLTYEAPALSKDMYTVQEMLRRADVPYQMVADPVTHVAFRLASVLAVGMAVRRVSDTQVSLETDEGQTFYADYSFRGNVLMRALDEKGHEEFCAMCEERGILLGETK